MVGEGGSWRNEKEERKDRTIGSININGVYERDWFERTEACIVAFAHFRGASN